MRQLAHGLIVVALVGVAAVGVWADTITVDGSDSDWISPYTTHDDLNGDVSLPGYDIDYTYFEWDEVNARRLPLAVGPDGHQHLARDDRRLRRDPDQRR